MIWTDYLINDRGIKAIYALALPSLDAVEVRQVTFKIDGPTISLGLELPEFPENPPAKWRDKGHNRVYVRLDFSGVRDVELKEWTTVGRAAIALRKEDALIGVRVIGEQFRLEFTSLCALIQEMTPYQVSPA